MKHGIPLLALSLSLATTSICKAQSSPELAPPSSDTPSQAWEKIKSRQAERREVAPSETPAAAKVGRAQRAAEKLGEADEARRFYAANPAHPQAAEARLIEVQGLVSAVGLGLQELEGRLESTVAVTRQDTRLSAPLRAEIAGTFEFTRVNRKHRDKPARLNAMAEAARGLMAEFPGQPQGYQTLLTVGRNSADESYREILFELSRKGAPSRVQHSVQTLLKRHFLAGEPLAVLLRDGLANSALDSLKRDRPTILYSWSPDNEASLRLAAEVEKNAPLAANLIGICLAPDSEAARSVAKDNKLPGFQYYHARGATSPLAVRLYLQGEPAVILADAQGHVRDTRGESALADKLAALGR